MPTEAPPTILEQMLDRGYTRRDFMKFCAYISATLGVQSTGLSSIVHALESKPRPPVVWFHFQECTCCSESFLRSSHPVVADIVHSTTRRHCRRPPDTRPRRRSMTPWKSTMANTS